MPNSAFVAKCGRCHKPLGIALADYYDIEDEDLDDYDDDDIDEDDEDDEDDDGDYDEDEE